MCFKGTLYLVCQVSDSLIPIIPCCLGEQVRQPCETVGSFKGIQTTSALPGWHPVLSEECEQAMWHQSTHPFISRAFVCTPLHLQNQKKNNNNKTLNITVNFNLSFKNNMQDKKLQSV